jgi:hypothetical protein
MYYRQRQPSSTRVRTHSRFPRRAPARIIVLMNGNRRREWLAVVVVVALLLLVPPGLYLAGYFWLAEYERGFWVPDRTPVVTRTYPTSWLEQFYKPAGRIEQRWMGYEVEIDDRSDKWDTVDLINHHLENERAQAGAWAREVD